MGGQKGGMIGHKSRMIWPHGQYILLYILKIEASLQLTREAGLCLECTGQMPNGLWIGTAAMSGAISSLACVLKCGHIVATASSKILASSALQSPCRGLCAAAAAMRDRFRLISPAARPCRSRSRGRAEFHSLVPTSSQSLQIISRQFSIMGDIRYG